MRLSEFVGERPAINPTRPADFDALALHLLCQSRELTLVIVINIMVVVIRADDLQAKLPGSSSDLLSRAQQQVARLWRIHTTHEVHDRWAHRRFWSRTVTVGVKCIIDCVDAAFWKSKILLIPPRAIVPYGRGDIH